MTINYMTFFAEQLIYATLGPVLIILAALLNIANFWLELIFSPFVVYFNEAVAEG